mmetsp:Transcript_1729/g.3406  ORF Transcript_1729/g.3406 Transcript_1729/m.3406 type:complete len:223 (+) Transcript_1729:385-1053(+)
MATLGRELGSAHALVTDTMVAVQAAARVIRRLDLPQSRQIVAPRALVPVWLVLGGVVEAYARCWNVLAKPLDELRVKHLHIPERLTHARVHSCRVGLDVRHGAAQEVIERVITVVDHPFECRLGCGATILRHPTGWNHAAVDVYAIRAGGIGLGSKRPAGGACAPRAAAALAIRPVRGKLADINHHKLLLSSIERGLPRPECADERLLSVRLRAAVVQGRDT